MKVSELIQELQKLNPNHDVVVEWAHGEYSIEPLMEFGEISINNSWKVYNHSKPNAVCLYPH